MMKKGFTLVETLVAVAIFSILVTIGVGGFTNALHIQREVASLIATQSNASIMLEQMAREIRTGYLFCHDLGSGVPNAACQFPNCTITGNTWNCSVLDFRNANAKNIDYELAGGALERSESGAGGQFVPISGDNVEVTYLNFTLFGNLEGDHWPPRITISLGVRPNSTDPAVANNILKLQTTVSAREIDCPAAPAAC